MFFFFFQKYLMNIKFNRTMIFLFIDIGILCNNVKVFVTLDQLNAYLK